jgi:hypothetical protein
MLTALSAPLKSYLQPKGMGVIDLYVNHAHVRCKHNIACNSPQPLMPQVKICVLYRSRVNKVTLSTPLDILGCFEGIRHPRLFDLDFPHNHNLMPLLCVLL